MPEELKKSELPRRWHGETLTWFILPRQRALADPGQIRINAILVGISCSDLETLVDATCLFYNGVRELPSLEHLDLRGDSILFKLVCVDCNQMSREHYETFRLGHAISLDELNIPIVDESEGYSSLRVRIVENMCRFSVLTTTVQADSYWYSPELLVSKIPATKKLMDKFDVKPKNP